jgi:pimeloyl-ACP methyl ester carboxylesterase
MNASFPSGSKILPMHPGLGAFPIAWIEAEKPRCIALFAVGRGGNPARHLPLMQTLAHRGCTVVAPHFDMLASLVPTKAELDLRIQRLQASLDRCSHSDLPVVGMGHSIGAAALLALQGAEGETLDGQHLIFGSTSRLVRLALLAPPTDFFRRPGALRRVEVPIQIWVGGKDTITPPAQSQFLRDALGAQTSVAIHVDPDAGHFTYMDELPPHAPEPHPDRRTFLAGLADEIAAFLTA